MQGLTTRRKFVADAMDNSDEDPFTMFWDAYCASGDSAMVDGPAPERVSLASAPGRSHSTIALAQQLHALKGGQ